MIQGKKCTQTNCPYHADRVEVPYDGSTQSDILIVGESPGREEIIAKLPFIGPSGQILTAVLESIGYPRSTVRVANACRCRIDKDKDTTKTINTALSYCRPKLARIIKQVNPKIIVALGAVALKQLTGLQKIMENRGRFFYSEEFQRNIFCTVHPAYVLRGSSREFWRKSASRRTMAGSESEFAGQAVGCTSGIFS